MPARRYWRIRPTTLITSWTLSEIEFFDTYTGVDRATGGTPIGTLATPANAFDDNVGTSPTASSVLGTWLGYDFGTAVDILRFSIRTSSTGSGIGPFVLEHSPDNSVWTVAGVYGIVWVSSTLYTFEVNQSAASGVRYVHRVSAGTPFPLNSGWSLRGAERFGRFAPQDMVSTDGGLRQRSTGTIGAFVRDAGQPVPGAYVRLHSRISGIVVGGGLTNGSGFVSFNGLNPDINDYYAVAFDPDGGEVYNALIFDRIQPS
ncbi:MAG: hypothetical protein ACRC2H_05615 [Silanimonas sp.]